MTLILRLFCCLGEMTWNNSNKGHFWKFWDLKKEFLLNKPCWRPKGLGEHHWVHSWHFGRLSPGVRTIPQKSPSPQNNGYFRDLPFYRGSYVAMVERQGKNKFPRVTFSMYCPFKKKGASIHPLPVTKQINTQKYSTPCWFKITTLISTFSKLLNI